VEVHAELESIRLRFRLLSADAPEWNARFTLSRSACAAERPTMTARSTAPSSAASETRYQFERKLGEGGAGAVYLVRDRETGEQLALKKLFRMDAKTVLRLKREFRSLQAVNHPNIIKLYDMGQASDCWFLTMEYLDGVDLTTYLDTQQPTAASSAEALTEARAWDDPRLLPAFRQLAHGIQALHDAGMLHRDLKPSNVLVVGDRVVMLDFGLMRELSLSANTLTEDGSIAGTPAYMAPEQLTAQELSAASDWYAFGVMLYEAASALLPIDGPLLSLLHAKLESDPEPLERLIPGVPRWLSVLCAALLRRNPAERPSGPEILARLEPTAPVVSARLPHTSSESLVTEAELRNTPAQLFGRATQTGQLWKALDTAEAGGSVFVHVCGASGAGKSALLEHFLDRVQERDSGASGCAALVLRSRCYELEAMPFKALDGVMDALARHLAGLDDLDVAHLLPADVTALTRVFPVLERLNAVKRLMAAARPPQDVLQTRRRAESAMRTLLENLAARSPIVIWIDDLQWGDLDSARILRSWRLQPSAAPILFVFSYRSNEVATSTCLRKLLDEDAEQPLRAAEHSIELAPLEAADIHALCEARLPANMSGRAELIERVAGESQGSPFLASQLLALVAAKRARGDTDLDALSLDLLVAQTSGLLADDAKQILAFLAVAGRPMLPKLVLQAAGVRRGGRALVHDLRALNLVRTRDVVGERMLEVYHDRVRERVQSALTSSERQQIHEQLLRTLECSGAVEPDWLHTLALGAGQHAAALAYGQAAAARAAASLAFERAAGLYRKCLELVPAAASGELWNLLSLALARCGRGVEAAEAALEGAKHVPEEQRLAWLLLAATHLLRSGRFARGEALVQEVLDAKRIDVPSSDAGLSAAIVWERARIKMHGSKDKLRAGRDVPSELLERFDLLASLFSTLSYHPLRSALFQARALRTALEAGEPSRLVEALCSASTAAAIYGSEQAARESDALLARAAAINAHLPVPHNQRLCVARALNAFMLGRMDEVVQQSREAERLFRADTQAGATGNYYHRLLVASVRVGALYARGEFAQSSAELHVLVDEAVATDNRALLLQLTYNHTLDEQLAGQVARSRPRLERQRAELPDSCFGSLHALHMIAEMSDARWSGAYAAVRDYVEVAWPKYLRSPARRASYPAFMAHSQHASWLLNQHVAPSRRAEAARAVQPDLDALDASPLPYAATFALQIRARVAFLNGQPQAAASLLRAAAAKCEQRGLAHYAARTYYALGTLLEGSEGAELRATAQQKLQALGAPDVHDELRAEFPELVDSRGS
jgi:eukaryotic-like serine/threonine-protein kinase